MRVLVTGANGFLGSWLCRALTDRGHDVRILVRPTSDLSELEGLQLQKVLGDVTDPESLHRACDGVDTVFHLAGLIAYKRSQRNAMWKVNVDGTRNVVHACEKLKIRRLVYLSSVVAIGASFSGKRLLDENSTYDIASLRLGYFDSKHEAEKIVLEGVRRGLDAVILNPATIYGPGDARKESRGTQLKVARGRFPFYTSGGVNVISVEDAVEGILAGWEKGRGGERYILGGENLLIKDLFRIIAEEAGVPAPRWRLPNFILFVLGWWGDLKENFGGQSSVSVENAWSSTMYHWFDNSKARRELGLHPRPAREAIRASVGWIREQGLLKS